MALIPEEEIDKVRSSADIVAVIGERLPLKRAGRHFKGLCPFHSEKTPSFMVNPERQIFHCFGCGEGGNVFTFLMKFDGIDFLEVVEQLAARAGIRLTRTGGTPADYQRAKDEKEQLLKVNRLAARFFYDQLTTSPEGKKGRDYLERREIRPEMIREGLLGFAPGGRALVRFLEEKKIPLTVAERLGLVRRGEGGDSYDFFRDRLLFTILSTDGKVLGFTGRALEEGVEPKYLNSPDSAVYTKGESLLGLRHARDAVREADQVVIVEGNFDQLRLVQGGIREAVAPLGTALTPKQVQLLSRWTRNFVLIFDGDAAGCRAADRSLEVFLPMGIFPKIVLLPAQEDPDTFVRKFGSDALRQKISVAVSLLDSFIERSLKEGGTTPEGKGHAVREVSRLLALLPGDVEKRLYIQQVSERLDLPVGLIAREVSQKRETPRRVSNFSAKSGDEGVKKVEKLPALERTLLELLLSGLVSPEILFKEISKEQFHHPVLSQIWEGLKEEFGKNREIAAARLLDRESDPETKQVLSELCVASGRWEQGDAGDLSQVVADLIGQIRKGELKVTLQGLTQEIREAERSQEGGRLKELLEKKSQLLKEMKTVH